MCSLPLLQLISLFWGCALGLFKAEEFCSRRPHVCKCARSHLIDGGSGTTVMFWVFSSLLSARRKVDGQCVSTWSIDEKLVLRKVQGRLSVETHKSPRRHIISASAASFFMLEARFQTRSFRKEASATRDSFTVLAALSEIPPYRDGESRGSHPARGFPRFPGFSDCPEVAATRQAGTPWTETLPSRGRFNSTQEASSWKQMFMSDRESEESACRRE